ncbi:MAG: glycosyltransferase family 2 protein [Oscillospiraceae bacterium]
MHLYLSELIVDVLEIFLFLIAAYYFVIAIFSLKSKKVEYKETSAKSFAILVPAHNAASGVDKLLEGLQELKYPKDKFSCFVIADNCTDDTVKVVNFHSLKMNVRIIERFDFEHDGKGYALQYGVNHVLGLNDETFDCIAFVDSDNRIDPYFLTEMNDCFNMGYVAVQGYIDSKNPTSSWLAHAYSMWYWINNLMNAEARFNLNLGVGLGGTGFAIDTKVIEKYGFDASCLAEDAELTMRLALDDINVGYAKSAVVFDEKPNHMHTSIFQRLRWLQGIADVQSKYIGKLIKHKKFNVLMTSFSDTLAPLCFGFFFIIYILATLSLFNLYDFNVANMWIQPLNYFVLNVYVFGNILIAAVGLIKDKKLNKYIILNTFGFLVYLITWIPVGLALIFKRGDTGWYHTKHDKADIL